MERFHVAITVLILAASLSHAGKGSGEQAGETLFEQHCAVCHPDGGNIINAKKTLHRNDMEANNVKTVNDIIKLMRNPGPGMLTFDEAAIPDDKAEEIAEYILKTYGK